MKKLSFLILLVVSYGFITCQQELTNQSDNTYKEHPIIVEIQGNNIAEGIEAFEAEVSVYRMNSRYDTGLKLAGSYNLLIEETDGERITYIDFNSDSSVERKAVISYRDNVIMLDPKTESVTQSMKIQQPQNPAYRLLSSQNYLSRINLSLIRQEAKRIALDIQTDDENILTLSIPPELAQMPYGDRRISSKISFDVKEEVLAATETVTISDNGTIVTVTTTPRYEKVDGVPVKTGQTTVTKVDIPNISVMPYDGIIYNSPDEIPTISNAEYEKLSRQGVIHKKSGMIFGNPNDLSYIETEVELYGSVKINNTPTLALRSWWQKLVHFIADPVGAIIYEVVNYVNNSNSSSSSGGDIIISSPFVPEGHHGYEGPVTVELPPVQTVDGMELYAKVSDEDGFGQRVYFFNGFPFEDYKASSVGMTDIIRDEYLAISRGGTYTSIPSYGTKTVNKSDVPYTIIGYSEGGLRALGYATYIERNHPEEFEKLKGVITISGANKGFKAMEGGIDVFKHRVYSMADILVNGIKAVNITDPAHYTVPAALPNPVNAENMMWHASMSSGFNILLSLIFPGPLTNYVLPAFYTNDYNSIAEIRDLVPFSAFANTYVCDAKVEIKKLVVGTESILIPSLIPYSVKVNKYEYYTVYSEEKIQFNKDLPVAYIAGTDNNTLGMFDDEQKVRDTLNGFATAFEAAEYYYKGINMTTFFDIFSSTSKLEQDARRAKMFLRNINYELNKLKGSTENDGLLAVDSMYYTQGNVIKYTDEHGNEFFYHKVDANHSSIGLEVGNETWDKVEEILRKFPR